MLSRNAPILLTFFAAALGTPSAAQTAAVGKQPVAPAPFAPGAFAPPPGNDTCATSTAIAGAGPHAFDSSTATTGAEGQSEPLCNAFGTSGIDRDVWFTWTARATTSFAVATCGAASIDTKIAVYAGSGCPASPALACNDDACGVQSRATFAATAGSTYTIQIGVFPATSGGAGSFTIVPSASAPANDECSSALVLAGSGPHAFDTTLATTSSDGQSTCASNGTTATANDLWYQWTSPAFGVMTLATCGQTSVDTKIAVYAACGGASLGCSDDACGAQSQTSFRALAGTTYLIQIGTPPGAAGGFGTFTLESSPTLIDPTEARIATAFDTGPLANPGPAPAIVDQRIVQTPGAAWSRAYFSAIELAPGSVVRITSLLDGETQELDRFTAKTWGFGSAYFNGDQVLVELVAAAQSSGNRIALQSIGAELQTQAACADAPCGACTPDGRVVSNEDWSGRWLGGGCTASVYDLHGCFVSAGHCFTTLGTVLGFRIPLSLNDCTMQVPPVADQFPVIATNANASSCSPDWRVGKLGPNSYGQTHYQRYGVYKPIASAPPPVSGAMDIYGFGSSSMRVVNGVQQRTQETITAVGGTTLSYSGGTTTGGTSGSGILHAGAIVGINTCCGIACSGIGSRIDQPAFVAARQVMCPHTVHADWDAPFCLNQTQTTVPITVCNTSSSTDTYLLSFSSVAPGPMCSVAGPTSFTVVGSNPIGPIAPGNCLTVNVVIQRPAGLTSVYLTGCYDVTATGVTSGLAVTERGSVQDRRDLCAVLSALPGGIAVLNLGVAGAITFDVRNDAVASGVIPFRAEAFAPDMEPSGAIALDGNFPGVAVTGVLNVPLGTTAQIDVDVLYRWLEPFDVSDLVLSTDVDGNGVFEPLASVGLRSVVGPTAVSYCAGDGTGTACPCANGGAPGNGCASSVNGSGANLAASGSPSLTSDTVVVIGSGMPNSSCLYFQGTTAAASGAGIVFGDGLRCVAGSVVRLGTKTNASGASSYPTGADPAVSVRGGITSAGSRYYQAWYRNAGAFCTASTFNLSNALRIDWTP